MDSTLLHIIVLGLVAAGVTLALAPATKWLSKRLGAIDYPSKRRINTYPVPRLGGLALFGGLLVALMFEAAGEHLFDWEGFFGVGSLASIHYYGVITGIAFVTAVGTVDDIKSLHPGLKFTGQIVGACIIAFSGVLLSGIGDPFSSDFIEFGPWAYPLTVLYLVAFANIINLIDGLDGLAAGVVSIAAFGLFIIAFSKGRMEAVMLSVILVGICLAFLRYNRYPASLYMGDSGALMLGTLLGIISLIGAMRSPTVIALIIPIVFAGIPVLDTLFTIIRRIRHGKPIHRFDLEHFHHILLRNGFHQRQAASIVCLWTGLLTGGGILISNVHGIMVYVLFVILVLISAFLMWRFGLFDSVLRHHYVPRERPSGSRPESPDSQELDDYVSGDKDR
ncbi:MAG: undecaprenyl/decaprenyl-phosphate alpha-N-acetylglucosaminyl 1-phosphate transferase [Coriobacteriales bacterium]|jgi:UDP-GlcNAc:undecaprenyl-phosphate GlcNAc-1-phosphate transferase|nr:undecaprenyl/decaprenyl-phosphate alpha-N-acetylglucosaminyl 1-phosphate transferase [Coriobacteriales bacterium]